MVFLGVAAALPPAALIFTFIVVYSVAALSVYITLEFLIFRELNKLYAMMQRMKKKDFKFVKRSFKNVSFRSINRLNEEFVTFAGSKEQEINELKLLENYRREFLADVSHELKTPIFAAQGFIHTLIDGAVDDPEVRDRFLKKAAKSLDGLDELVKDLITLSQMETGAIQMQPSSFEASTLVHEVFEQLEEIAEKRSTALRFERKPDRALQVFADRNRIRQVLQNLIENAVKYGHDNGKITVSLDADKDFVTFSVRDDGPGIAGEHLKRIFERFYRIDKSRSKEKGGSGLGLAIVKQIVEAHEGKIAVSSRVGKGTAFSFKLKKAKTDGGATGLQADEAASALPSAIIGTAS